MCFCIVTRHYKTVFQGFVDSEELLFKWFCYSVKRKPSVVVFCIKPLRVQPVTQGGSCFDLSFLTTG